MQPYQHTVPSAPPAVEEAPAPGLASLTPAPGLASLTPMPYYYAYHTQQQQPYYYAPQQPQQPAYYGQQPSYYTPAPQTQPSAPQAQPSAPQSQQTLVQRAQRWNTYCEQAVNNMKHLFKGYEKELRIYQGRFKKAIAANTKVPMMWYLDNCKKYDHYASNLKSADGFDAMVMGGQVAMLDGDDLRTRWQQFDMPTREAIRKHVLTLYLIAMNRL